MRKTNRKWSRIILYASALVVLVGLGTHAEEKEITFIHVGDTHYNTRAEDFEEQRERFRNVIAAMNDLPGTPYPNAVGGIAGTPMGVFVVGDLTESRQSDFEAFVQDWGLKGGDGLLDFPVYEGAGNHDGPPSTHPRGVVRRSIIERNPKRPHLADLSENQLHYSLDYLGVHFVQLNEYGGIDNEERYPGNPEYDRKGQSYGNPSELSLPFLEKTLAEHVGDSGRPVILFQHYGFDGWPLNPWGDALAWWTEEQALRLWEAIEPYNVISIHVGHDHSHNVLQWNGIPVYHMDALRGFAVYRLREDAMVRVVRNPATREWGPVHRQGTAIAAAMPDQLLQGPYLVYSDDPSKMTVLWRTREKTDVRFRWGRDNFRYESGTVQMEPHNKELGLYRITLSNLEPNTRYTYQLKVGGKYAPGMFYSAPEEETDKVKFLIYGATATGHVEQENISRALYAKIYEDPAYHSLLVHAGNWLPRVDRIRDWDHQFFSRRREVRHARYIQARMPLMGAVGEREGDTALFRELFPYEYAGENYHSFRYGPAHIAVIDPYQDYSQGSPQYRWLAADLRDADAAWKILLFNGPDSWQSEGPAGARARDLLQPLCEEHGVNLVIDGSADGYTRTSFGNLEYIGLGAKAAPGRDAAYTMHFGAVHIESGTLALEVFDDTGEKVDTLRLPAE